MKSPKYCLCVRIYLSIFIELDVKTEKYLKHKHTQAHIPLATDW